MKKTIIYIIAALLLCPVLASCSLLPGNNNDSKSKENSSNSVNNKKSHTFTFSYYDGPDGYLPDLWSTCYGEYSGCSVRFQASQCSVVTIIEVGGYKFPFGSSFSITAEKDGEIYDLKDAFEKGFLTSDDIAQIYEIHKEFVTEYHNGSYYY